MKRFVRTITVCAVTSVLALGVGSISKAQRQGSALVVSTKKVERFRTIQGSPQWEERTKQRIAGATWRFNPDGTFIYAPVNSRTDLFPIQGRYQKNGDTIVFSGSRSSSTGYTGSAHAEIRGKQFVQGNRRLLTMTVITTSGNAAVINRQKFAGANAQSYEFTVSLR